jgi:hypothetical protein
MAKLGGLLMLLSFVLLGFNLSPLLLSDNQPILKLMEPLLCAPGETLTMDVVVTQDFDGTGYSGDYDCMRRNESSYDVSDKAFVYAAISFVVPFLLGLTLFLVAWNRATRGIIPSGGWEIQTGGTTVQISGASMQSVPLPPSQIYNFDAIPGTPAPSELTNRLQQLRDAYNAGMISHDEYQRTRAEVLKDFANADE